MKVKAIEVRHNARNKKHRIFTGSVKVKDLVDASLITVDHWKPEKINSNDQGYQRTEEKKHVSNIKKAIFQNGIDFPTSILLSYRREKNNEPLYIYNDKSSELELQNSPIYLVDGQHRAAGIREFLIEELKLDPKLNNVEVPAVFMIGLNKFEEMRYFEIINTTARKVNTGLANELLTEQSANTTALTEIKNKNKLWLVKAVKIAHILNTRETSAWYKRIKLPNEEINKNLEKIASLGQFVSSLKVVIENSVIESHKLDEVTKILDDYWKALRNIFPQAFLYPKKHVIQKTVGMFSLHKLLDRIIGRLSHKRLELSEKNMEKILVSIFSKCALPGFQSEHENSKYWQRGYRNGASFYRGQAGFKELFTYFMDEGLNGD